MQDLEHSATPQESAQELFEAEKKKLTDFVTQLAKYLDPNEALLYLERWQINACQRLAEHFEVRLLEDVWLNQQFELEAEEQVSRLIVCFFDVLDTWADDLGLNTQSGTKSVESNSSLYERLQQVFTDVHQLVVGES